MASVHEKKGRGLGIGTAHNQNTPERMIEEMRISRALKADGVVHSSSASLREPFLDRLKKAQWPVQIFLSLSFSMRSIPW